MIKNTYPIQPGVGWGEDLTVKLHESYNNNWFPQIHPGYYYLNGKESYLYALEIREAFTIPSGIYTYAVSAAPDFGAASHAGPISLTGVYESYIKSSNNMSVLNVVTPTTGTTLYSIPVTGNVILVTDGSNTDFISVGSSGFLTERNFYYNDGTNLYISRAVTDPNRLENLYITYLTSNTQLKQEEIQIVSNDGKIRVAYDRVSFGFGNDPVIVIPGSGTTTASSVTKNVITTTTAIPSGTRVGVKYYINKSFVINQDYTLGTYTTSGDSVYLKWEGAYDNSYYDSATVSASSLIQLNPLNNGITDGFIYLTPPYSPVETLNSILINCFPRRASNKFQEVIRIRCMALDTNTNVMSRVPLSAYVSGGDGTTYALQQLNMENWNGTTDLKGCIHFAWQTRPNLSGIFVVFCSGTTTTGTIVSGSTTFVLDDPPILGEMSKTAKLYLYLNPNVDDNGYRDIYVEMVDQSGIPFDKSLSITLTCNLGYFLINNSSSGSNLKTTNISLSIDNSNYYKMVLCKYYAVNGDILKGFPTSDNSNNQITLYKFETVPLEVSI